MSFSIVATCYNDEKKIRSFIECIRTQTVQPDEVIIADGGSTDDTIQELEKVEMRNIKLISGKRLNIAQGYNEAIKAATTDLVIILGVGNLYSSNFCEELLKQYFNGCAAVYGKLMGIDKNAFSRAYNIVYLNGSKGIDLGIPSNRGALVPRATFSQYGLFLENFVYAGEDTEFYRRLIRAKTNIKYASEALIFWETPSTLKEYYKQQNGYFLGRFQHTGINIKEIIRGIVVLFLTIALFVLCALEPVVTLVGLLCGIFALVWCTRTINLSAWLIFYCKLIFPVFFLLKNIKYINKEYIICR